MLWFDSILVADRCVNTCTRYHVHLQQYLKSGRVFSLYFMLWFYQILVADEACVYSVPCRLTVALYNLASIFSIFYALV